MGRQLSSLGCRLALRVGLCDWFGLRGCADKLSSVADEEEQIEENWEEERDWGAVGQGWRSGFTMRMLSMAACVLPYISIAMETFTCSFDYA